MLAGATVAPPASAVTSTREQRHLNLHLHLLPDLHLHLLLCLHLPWPPHLQRPAKAFALRPLFDPGQASRELGVQRLRPRSAARQRCQLPFSSASSIASTASRHNSLCLSLSPLVFVVCFL